MSVLCRREFVAAVAVEAGPTREAPFMETVTPPPAATGLPTGWPPLLGVAIGGPPCLLTLVKIVVSCQCRAVLRPSCVRLLTLDAPFSISPLLFVLPLYPY